MPNINRQQLFTQWAATYDTAVSDQADFPFAGYANVLTAIVAQSLIQPASTVLDLGTGTGNLAIQLIAQTPHVVGVDFAENMLNQARQKAPQATFAPLDLSADDWSVLNPYQFDRVVAAYVLHEFPLSRVVAILERLRATYTTPNCRIVIGDIAFPSSDIRRQAQSFWGKQWDSDEYYFAADEANAAFQTAGFSTAYQQISSCAGVFVLEPGWHN